MKKSRQSRLLIDRWHIVRITTDTGLVGVGESSLWGYPEASERIVAHWAAYLIGQDPLRIEHHWQYLYRNALHGLGRRQRVGAVDIALWDIAGKHYGAPVYALLGGSTRHKVRCYIHVHGDTAEALAADAKARRCGLHRRPLHPVPGRLPRRRYGDVLAEIIARVGAVRESVGPAVDLCVEIHRRMTPMEAIGLARELAAFRPFFLEDPILPDSVQSMAEVRGRSTSRSPPASVSPACISSASCWWPAAAASSGRTSASPAVCRTPRRSALAEAFHVGVIPHNPLSPISTAACVRLDACIPNFVLQEYTGEDQPPKRDLVTAAAGGGWLSARARDAGHRHRAGRGGARAATVPAAGAGDAAARGRLGRRPVAPAPMTPQ